MTEIGRHMWVQCVDEGGLDPEAEPLPRLNGVYYVLDIQDGIDWRTGVINAGLLLGGCNPECVWNIARFRPLGNGPGVAVRAVEEVIA